MMIRVGRVTRVGEGRDFDRVFWPLVPEFAGSNPAEAVGFFCAQKNSQHAFLRRGS
jgi:hypothetical protein